MRSHVNNDLLSCQQSTSDNNGDNNSKSAADTINNEIEQRNDFSDLDSISSLHSSAAEENIERAFEEGVEVMNRTVLRILIKTSYINIFIY